MHSHQLHRTGPLVSFWRIHCSLNPREQIFHIAWFPPRFLLRLSIKSGEMVASKVTVSPRPEHVVKLLNLFI
jgi:hypothetical protein